MNVPTVNPNSVQGFSSQPSWATHQPVQCGRQEFRVIYDATAISIHVLERREVKRQNWGCSQKLVVSNLGKTQLYLECHGISQSYLYLNYLWNVWTWTWHGQFRFDHALEEPKWGNAGMYCTYRCMGYGMPVSHDATATHLPSAGNHTSIMACRSGGISFKPACAGAGISGKKSDGSVLQKSSKSTSAMTPCHTILHQTRPNRITTSCRENCPSMSNSRLHALKLVHQLHHAFCKPSLSSAGVSKPSPPKARSTFFHIPDGLVAGAFIAIFQWGGGTGQNDHPALHFMV